MLLRFRQDDSCRNNFFLVLVVGLGEIERLLPEVAIGRRLPHS